MRKKSIIVILLVVVLAAAGLFIRQVAYGHEAPQFRFTTVEKGDLQSVVSATGTLNAVTTVSVGTQVSGQISQLLVDYNDHVTRGEVLARIDPTLAQQAVTDAQANLEKVRAQELQASRDQNRNAELSASGLIAKSALEQTGSTLQVAQADVKSAQVALDRARQNLSYTVIQAPIDGVIVERNVSSGQTVAASLSAPQLFLIANDMSHMQILAQVSESDIAQIKEGQNVRFTVQALAGQTFQGTVQQVRLESTTTDNVVNYTVVVAVDNAQNKLLPGMTARVDFLVKSASDVLKVSNAALRYQPSADVLAQLGNPVATKTSTTSTTATTATTTSAVRADGGAARTRTGQGKGSSSFGKLYYLDANGKLQIATVRTGINDGTSTEITGKNVTAGMKVIAGAQSTTQTASTTAATTSSSPFGGSSQRQGGGGRAPGGF